LALNNPGGKDEAGKCPVDCWPWIHDNEERRMHEYESLIEELHFGIVADELKKPRSAIRCIVYVKEPAKLAALAEELDHEMDEPAFAQFGRSPECINRLLRDGSVMYSLRDDEGLAGSAHYISASTIDRWAPCEAVWVAPIYLVYTPGFLRGSASGKTLRGGNFRRTIGFWVSLDRKNK
jgi:hypothetical protein